MMDGSLAEIFNGRPFYLDIIKDRLYTSAAKSTERKAAQTVLYELTDSILRLMSPVLTFTAEEVWAYLPEDPERHAIIDLSLFPAKRDDYLRDDLDKKWNDLIKVRSELTKALELARANKVIGHSLEAEVSVCVDGKTGEFLQDKWGLLQTISIISGLQQKDSLEGEDVYTSEEIPGMRVQVVAASGEKCERCWTRSSSVGDNDLHPQICDRCCNVLEEIMA